MCSQNTKPPTSWKHRLTMATTSLHRLLQGCHVPLSILAPPPINQRGSLAAFPPMDPALLLRLEFLWQQSLAHLPTNPTYSRVLSRQLVRARDVALAHVALHPRLPDLLCPDCGVILVPGLTARARLHPRRTSCPVNANRRRRNDEKHHRHQHDRTSGGENSRRPVPMLRNEVAYACLLCQGIRKRDGVPRRTGAATTSIGKESCVNVKVQGSIITTALPSPPSEQRTERQSILAPAEEEDFIPLHPESGKKRPYQPQAQRLLLDAKPRKRKGKEEMKKLQQQQQLKSGSRSIGQLRGFLSSLKKP